MKFTKMHGLGNDYVYVNCFEETVLKPANLAIEVSDRHTGIGSDGLILICPSEIADAKMRMFNADGSEAEMCGNGLRCVAKYVYDHGIARGEDRFSIPGLGTFDTSLRIETGNGVLKVGLDIGQDEKAVRMCVDMGQPVLAGRDIPVAISGEDVVNEPIHVGGKKLMMTCVSMGNPHVTFFVDDLETIDLRQIGPMIENHELFPERVNVHFVSVDGPNEFTMITWERGSGFTMACGTGACACGVAAVLTGKCERNTLAHLPGGNLELSWCEEDNNVYMTGPAVEVFTGEWPE
jgi:diaminopimelate epimerase